MAKNEISVDEQMKEMETFKEELKAMQEALAEQRNEIAREMEDLKAERLALTEETSKLLAAKTALEQTSAASGTKREDKPVKMVKVKLHKDKNTKRDVFVSVNGKTWQIQRGVEVEVPDFVKEVLTNTEKMDNLALERIEQAVRNFDE